MNHEPSAPADDAAVPVDAAAAHVDDRISPFDELLVDDEPRARGGFARFARTRPLVGGLLVALAGIEIFLSTQLDLGSIQIQVGIEGFQATLIPFLLLVAGVLLVFDPAHRIFYGVIAMAVSVYAIVGVNLGGFLVGTVLGLVGSVVALSWREREREQVQDAALAAQAEVSRTAIAHNDETGAQDERTPEPPPFPSSPADSAGIRPRGRRAAGLLVVALLATGVAVPGIASAPAHAEDPAVCDAVVVSTVCDVLDPSPSATTPASPAPSAPEEPAPPTDTPDTKTPGTKTPDTKTPDANTPDAAPDSSAHDEETNPLLEPQDADATVPVDSAAPVVAGGTATLTASSLSQTHGRYVGTVKLRLPDGSTVKALKILGDAGVLKGVRLHGAEQHGGVGIDTDRLDVAGPITFYAVAFSGKALGVLPLSWSIASPPPTGIEMPPFTDVTVELVYFGAGGQTLSGSHITPR